MGDNQFQPYSTQVGTYQPFNYLFYYCHKHNEQPCVYRPNRILYSDSCLKKLEKKYNKVYELTSTVRTKNGLKTITSTYGFENGTTLIFLERAKFPEDDYSEDEYDLELESHRNDALSDSLVMTILYKSGSDLKEILSDFTPRKEKNKNNIFLIVGSSAEGFALKDFKTKLPTKDMDLELNYGSAFTKKHKLIINKLNTPSSSGLVILNGQPGTGKTTYIKYLTTQIDKKIIFVPPSMAEGITAPNSLPFLMENKNSILVIEDAEKVIGSRESNDTNNGVSNILNMTDGILGDCLNIQIIATLNTPRERIDPALLRKGRLIVEHEFTELPIENVEKLFKALGIKDKPDKPMTLTDIYNYEKDKEEKKEAKPPKRLGFFMETEK